MKHFTLVLVFLLSFNCFSQLKTLSKHAEVSILTIGQGDEALYDRFGHSALRLKDSINNLDVVFNYGYFNFNAPNFYLNFAKGKLQYKLAVNYFKPFINSYKNQNRWVKEQVLNLTYHDKQVLNNYLWQKAKPEHSGYLYDFFYNNCATKLVDALKQVFKSKIVFNYNHITTKKSFRTLINENLNWNSWGHFGINIALGSIIDKQTPPQYYRFLPSYSFQAIAHGVLRNQPLVKNTKTLVDAPILAHKTFFLTSPFLIVLGISLLIISFTFSNYKNKHRSKWLDVFLFFSTGLVGVLLVLLWLATDHHATAYNYNILWAFPINLFVFWLLFKNQVRSWFINYLKFICILFALMTLHWIIGIQQFSPVLIPLCIALIYRYWFLIVWYKKQLTIN